MSVIEKVEASGKGSRAFDAAISSYDQKGKTGDVRDASQAQNDQAGCACGCSQAAGCCQRGACDCCG